MSDNGERPKTEAQIADVLYGDRDAVVNSYAPALRYSIEQLGDLTGKTRADLDEYTKNMAVTFYEGQIPPEAAVGLHELIVRYAANPPSDDEFAEWERQSQRKLRERYDDADRASREKKVKEFVRNRPQLAEVLSNGLGSHPLWVESLYSSAHHLRVQPRPQPKGKLGQVANMAITKPK